MKDSDVKLNLLMDGARFLNEARDQGLKLENAKTATGPPLKLR
jgi:threonine aldolase